MEGCRAVHLRTAPRCSLPLTAAAAALLALLGACCRAERGSGSFWERIRAGRRRVRRAGICVCAAGVPAWAPARPCVLLSAPPPNPRPPVGATSPAPTAAGPAPLPQISKALLGDDDRLKAALGRGDRWRGDQAEPGACCACCAGGGGCGSAPPRLLRTTRRATRRARAVLMPTHPAAATALPTTPHYCRRTRLPSSTPPLTTCPASSTRAMRSRTRPRCEEAQAGRRPAAPARLVLRRGTGLCATAGEPSDAVLCAVVPSPPFPSPCFYHTPLPPAPAAPLCVQQLLRKKGVLGFL